MADQVERVVLDASDRTASATASANRNIGSVEDRAARANRAIAQTGEQVSRTIVSVTDRTANQIRRVVESAEARVASIGKTPIQRLQAMQQGALSKVIGDPAAVERVTSAYAKMIAAEHAAEETMRASRMGQLLKESITDPTGAASGGVVALLRTFGKVGIVSSGAVLGLAAVGVEAFKIVEASGKAAESISNLSDVLGLSIGQTQEIADAARIAGVGVEMLGGLTRKLSQTLADGGPQSVDAVRRMEALGISVVDASGKFRNSVDLIRDLSREINKLPDNASQVKLLTDVFGRGAIELLPLIKNFGSLEAQVKSLGPALEDNVIKRLAEADDKLDKLGISFDRIKMKLAEKLVVVVDFLQGDSPISRAIGGALLGSIPGGIGLGLIAAGGISQISRARDGAKALAESGQSPIDKAERLASQQDLARGNKLVQSFRNRVDEESIQREITRMESTRTEIGARINVGAGEAVQRAAIQQFDAISARIETAKQQLKLMREQPAADKAAADSLIAAERKYQDELGKTKLEAMGLTDAEVTGYNARMAALTKFTASMREAQSERKDSAAVVASYLATLDVELKTAAVMKQAAIDAEHTKQLKLDAEFAAGESKRIEAFEEQTSQLAIQRAVDRYGDEEKIAGRARDRELRGLEAINAQTLQERIATEQARAAIEVEYAAESLRIQKERITQQVNFEAGALEEKYGATVEVETRIRSMQDTAEARRVELTATTEDQILAIKENAAIAASKMIIAEDQKIFDRFKSEANGVLDAMFTKTSNIFSAIGNAVKSFALTAVKDIASSHIAAALTSLVTGQSVTLENQAPIGNTRAARIAAAIGLGSIPIFGGGAVAKIDRPGHLADLTLRNGAVPVVIQGVGGPGGGAVQQITSGGGSSGGGFSLAKAALGFGGGGMTGGAFSGSPSFEAVSSGLVGDVGPETITPFGGGPMGLASTLGPGRTSGFAGPLAGYGGGGGASGGLGGILQNLGNTSGGFLKAGSALPALGLLGSALGLRGAFGMAKKGGLGWGIGAGALGAVSGLLGFGALASIFPALVAAGPAGWIAAAGIGAAIGLSGLFFKNPDQKIVDRVKSIYRITVDKGFVSKALRPIIDQKYGGDIEVGLRSPEVRDLLQLYARSRLTVDEQRNFPLQNIPQPVGLSLGAGGALTQDAALVNGGTIGYGGGTAQLSSMPGQLITGLSAPGGYTNDSRGTPIYQSPPVVIVQSLGLHLDGQSASALLMGQVANNPGVVATAQLEAAKSSINRREVQAAQSTPGLLFA